MKKITVALTLAVVSSVAFGATRPQPNLPELTFTTIKENPITPVKDQYRSGTCWVFSSLGFIESEVIRINAIADSTKFPDFSEFYVVSNSYRERAEKYVRLDGHLGFSAGSEGDDVLDVIRNHGIVPQSEMTGMQYGSEKPEQAELDAVLKAMVDAVVSKRGGKLTTAWKKAVGAVLDTYLGKRPEKFKVDGKEYTPASYRDALKINPDDYVTLTSFTHHPFYSEFVIELADNWRGSSVYNVPLDEMMNVIDGAINAGYTLEWGADVSQWGFTRNGFAILLKDESKKQGSDAEHWAGKEEGKPAPAIEIVEKVPTQESRQEEFDNKTLTDDHGMQIFGIASDQNGKKYYKVKNSWGDAGKFAGIWYATEAFVKGQTITVTVHKDSLPKDLKKKISAK